MDDPHDNQEYLESLADSYVRSSLGMNRRSEPEQLLLPADMQAWQMRQERIDEAVRCAGRAYRRYVSEDGNK